MQGIVLFIEPSDDAFFTPSKIGHLFMNRFAIDEDAGFEILSVLELEKTSYGMSGHINLEYENYKFERQVKGLGPVDTLYTSSHKFPIILWMKSL